MSYHKVVVAVRKEGGRPIKKTCTSDGEGYLAVFRLHDSSRSLLQVVRVQRVRLVELRNPWGRQEVLSFAFRGLDGEIRSGDLTDFPKRGVWKWGEALVRLL